MAVFWTKQTSQAKGLNLRNGAVLAKLADVANKDGTSWCEQLTLAEKCGCSERTIRTALAELEAMGWIYRTRRWRPNGSRSSDLIHLRTFEEAKAWALENIVIPGDAPTPPAGPGSKTHEAANDPATTPARQRVNTPTEIRDQTRRVAAEIAPIPVEKIHQDLTIRLQTEGLTPPPLAGEVDPRKARGS